MEHVGDTGQLGQLIREKRRSLGMRQNEAAGLMGVGVRFLSELERGKPTCEIGKVFQVLARLGLEVWVGRRQAQPRDKVER